MSQSCTEPSMASTSSGERKLSLSHYLQRAEEGSLPPGFYAPRMSEEFDINQFLSFSHDDDPNKGPISLAEKDILTQDLLSQVKVEEQQQPPLLTQEQTELPVAVPIQDFSQIDQFALLNALRQQQLQQPQLLAQLQSQAQAQSPTQSQNIQQQLLSQLYPPFLPWLSDLTQTQFPFVLPAQFDAQTIANLGARLPLGLPAEQPQNGATLSIPPELFAATPLSSLSNFTNMLQPGFAIPNFFPGFLPQVQIDANGVPTFPVQQAQMLPFQVGTSFSVPTTPATTSPLITPQQQQPQPMQRRNSFSNLTHAGQLLGHRKTKSDSSVPTGFLEDFVMYDNEHMHEEEGSDEGRPPTPSGGFLTDMAKNPLSMMGVDASMFSGGLPVINAMGTLQQVCKIPDCLVCNRPLPDILRVNAPSWSAILRIVFYTLKVSFPEKDFFNLRNHVYDFVETHWQKICIGKTKSEHWRKQLQDTLAHNKKLFVSGADVYKQKGFWKLDELTDPWEEKNATTLLAEKHEREARFKERSAKRLRMNPIGSAAM